jgi:hypothetical protein
MKELSGRDRPSAVRIVYLALRHRLPLETETVLFVMASTLDALLTLFLLRYGGENGHTFIESNPIPRYFLESWGLGGLVYFKFALVTVIALICQIIARRKIEVARRVLNFASLVVMGVVIYSAALMLQHG